MLAFTIFFFVGFVLVESFGFPTIIPSQENKERNDEKSIPSSRLPDLNIAERRTQKKLSSPAINKTVHEQRQREDE